MSDTRNLATLMNLQSVVTALIQTHPNPEGVKAIWQKLIAVATENWARNAIAKGFPGIGKEEIESVRREWETTFDASIKNLRNK